MRLATHQYIADQLFDCVQTVVDVVDVGQRIGQPFTEQAGSHCRDGFVQDGQQATGSRAFPHRAIELETAASGLVDSE